MGTRTLSSLILIALGFAVVGAGGWVFTLWVAGLGLVLADEWAGVTRAGRRDATLILHAAGGFAAAILAGFGQWPWVWGALALSGVGAALAASLRKGGGAFWAALGVLLTGAPQAAFIALRAEPTGFFLVVGLMFLVGMTDTASLIVGKTFGGPRFAPRISPHKTWSGLLGGAAVGAAAGAVFGALTHSEIDAWRIVVIALALACATQAGDIAQSALKRHFQKKDAGRLIPGHGGAMDRFDGALVAAMLAGLILAFAP